MAFHSCNVCSFDSNESYSIQCRGKNCTTWVHYSCSGLPAYFIVLLSCTKISYYCPLCVAGKYSFHANLKDINSNLASETKKVNKVINEFNLSLSARRKSHATQSHHSDETSSISSGPDSISSSTDTVEEGHAPVSPVVTGSGGNPSDNSVPSGQSLSLTINDTILDGNPPSPPVVVVAHVHRADPDMDILNSQQLADKEAKERTKSVAVTRNRPNNRSMGKVPGPAGGTIPGKQPVPRKSEVCKSHLQGVCRFGTSGRGCTLRHPKLCPDFCSSGKQGCARGSKCSFSHPSLCNFSLVDGICKRRRCDAYHVAGSSRPNIRRPASAFVKRSYAAVSAPAGKPAVAQPLATKKTPDMDSFLGRVAELERIVRTLQSQQETLLSSLSQVVGQLRGPVNRWQFQQPLSLFC